MSDEPSAPATIRDARSFPAGGGELGALIRQFDWSKTSLGAVASWPQSLKTATDIVLQSPLPLVMLWGPDGVMIYNDAYSGFAGQRHPRLLGSKVLEGWAEVADFNAHVMQVVLGGGTLSFKDQELTLYRNDRAERVWMDLSYGPVFDESGRPAGVLAIVVETTARVLAERRSAFLLQLGDRLRELSDSEQITLCAVSLLGEHLGAARAGWAEVDPADGALIVGAEWTKESGGCAGAGRREPLDEAWAVALAGAGRLVRIDVEPTLALVAPAAASGVTSVMTAPLVKDGRLAALLFVHCTNRRQWTEQEQALARDAAERTWIFTQRAVATDRLRQSEGRLRALVNATSDVIYRMSPDWTEMRQLDGRGFLADIGNPSIDWMGLYLLPEDQPTVRAAIDEAIRQKRPFQLEHKVRQADGAIGWTISRAVPILNEDGEITDWFGVASDVTGRRQSEEHLRLVINELNHRVKNNLSMIQAISAQTFRNAPDLEKAQAGFTARILALAKANDLLTDEHWVDASLREVIVNAVQPQAPQQPERLSVEGPLVRLSAKTALSLCMAFHELATNAVKYGAWSNEAGKVDVSWRTTADKRDQALRLVWREQGGPPVRRPERRGFGSRLVERGLAAELEGEVELLFEPEGLICTVDARLRGPA